MTSKEASESIARPEQMFCFQCEQTAWQKGCTGARGMCGKPHETANEQDALTGALIGLARTLEAGDAPTKESNRLILAGLFTTVTNVDFDRSAAEKLKDRIEKEKEKAAANGQVAPDYDIINLWNAPVDIRSLKSLVLFGLRGMSAYAYHAFVLGYEDPDLMRFFSKALAALGDEELGPDRLRELVLETGKAALTSMKILDKANTETFGNPEPTEVSMKIEKGPFIVVTGHDLHDLKLLLEQTEGKGVNVYTHGEMLPAHAYPGLKKYSHLKGNFGTAWQRQRKEFKDIPAPVVFTTNCLMPPADYADRIFTTDVVAYKDIPHIDEKKDFTPVVEKALELGGYQEDQQQHGINGGDRLVTGFGHAAVLSHADEVIEAVKSGALRHIFLVGGCDGAYPSRSYYTEFVKMTPKDTLVLTLACGKYRFNDIDLGNIGALPRLMDMGQCNDAYSAIVVAQALAEAFSCGVNELPLSLNISWYEQKAVCVLLALLALGIKNIRLGPTLPAFVSPDVLQFLSDTFALQPIGDPKEDLEQMLG